MSLRLCLMPKMASVAISDGVHTERLYFEERDNKDQRIMQTETLRVNVAVLCEPMK